MPFSLCACKEIHMYRPNWIFRCSIVKVFRVILRKPDYLRCSCLCLETFKRQLVTFLSAHY